VPETAIEVESESRTTRENCLRVKERFAGREPRVLLVTSALHMPRAMASCRGAGLVAIPAATDVEVVANTASGWLAWLPDAETLDASERAVKEYLGLAVYWARGWLAAGPAG
jgi:uncharacterized SAM-binding protein YcdF (DUF218 family)